MPSIAMVIPAHASRASSAKTSHVSSAETTHVASAETAHVAPAETTTHVSSAAETSATAAVSSAAATATATAACLCTRRKQRPGQQGGCQYHHRSSSSHCIFLSTGRAIVDHRKRSSNFSLPERYGRPALNR
jgi:mannose-6-phosphate isomerase-like protein (cupin superfamily)